jgi:hypothetical protein
MQVESQSHEVQLIERWGRVDGPVRTILDGSLLPRQENSYSLEWAVKSTTIL